MPGKKPSRRWKPRPGEEELLRQVHLAGQQIDAHDGGRLGWVVDFAREEPSRWLPSDLESRGCRLLALVFPVPHNLVGGTSIYPLSPREVASLHRDLSAKLRELVSGPAGKLVDFPAEGLKTVLVRASKPEEKPAIFGFSRGGPFRTMLWQIVAELVRDSDRLIACHACGEPILALRKKKFCDSRCAQKWHDREKVKRKQAGVGR